ncbi:hypothetical protein BaRGS_00027767, partial [Batillaria attramentaria]
SYGPAMEFLRCIICLGIAQLCQPISLQVSAVSALYLIYFLSALFWGYLTFSNFQFRLYRKKVQ